MIRVSVEAKKDGLLVTNEKKVVYTVEAKGEKPRQLEQSERYGLQLRAGQLLDIDIRPEQVELLRSQASGDFVISGLPAAKK